MNMKSIIRNFEVVCQTVAVWAWNERSRKVEADVAICPLRSLLPRRENRNGVACVPQALCCGLGPSQDGLLLLIPGQRRQTSAAKFSQVGPNPHARLCTIWGRRLGVTCIVSAGPPLGRVAKARSNPQSSVPCACVSQRKLVFQFAHLKHFKDMRPRNYFHLNPTKIILVSSTESVVAI